MDVLVGYGFRGSCSCGWSGAVRGTVALARVDLAEHLAEPELDEPAAG